MPPARPTHTVLRLRLELDEVEPPIWRELLIPGGAKLSKLHHMLQVVMGWNDSHLHAFRIGATSFGPLDEDDDPDDDAVDERAVTILEAFGSHDHAVYEYDFGDGWEHQLVVAERLPQWAALKFAVCLGGANACPPDDVGGPGGYGAFLAAMGDPDHEEHDDFMEWIGGPFDPTAFDLGEANIALQAIR
jgi:hypothetical protein